MSIGRHRRGTATAALRARTAIARRIVLDLVDPHRHPPRGPRLRRERTTPGGLPGGRLRVLGGRSSMPSGAPLLRLTHRSGIRPSTADGGGAAPRLLNSPRHLAPRARLTERARGGDAVTGRRSGARQPVARSSCVTFRVRDGIRRPGRRAGGGVHPDVVLRREAFAGVGGGLLGGVGVVVGRGCAVHGGLVGGGARAEGGGELGEADVVRVLLVHVDRDPPVPAGVGRQGAGASAARGARIRVRNAHRHPARRARVRR
ncbi:hypothetical protein G4H13_47885 [Streptomyces rapamycinicus]|uniref:Uncharacterized protein n=1 Tax=Streptomyces rhizosphaericus TaxID=114699 RepID=A0A6G4AZ43_9ACTN|nr:hypothetical protein [Streptomyces rhizosphaericus]